MNDYKLPLLMRLNKWFYLSFMIIFFAAGIGFSFLAAKNDNKGIYFLGIVCFLISTFSMTSFFSRIFKFKPKKEVYKTKNYNLVVELDLVSSLKKDGFEFRKNSIGYIASKIEGKTCYKVTIVDNVDEYLNPSEEKNDTTKTKGIEKCNEFVAFEFFTKNDQNIYDKAPALSFAGEKVSYTSFIYNDDAIVECNVVDALTHKDSKEKLLKKLNLIEKE